MGLKSIREHLFDEVPQLDEFVREIGWNQCASKTITAPTPKELMLSKGIVTSAGSTDTLRKNFGVRVTEVQRA